MHSNRRSQFRSGRLATAIAGFTCLTGPATPAHDLHVPSRVAQVEVIRRDHLGVIDKGWWKALYTASFVEPNDVGHRKFGPLQLFSYDEIQPGGAFKLHPHENIEVITIVLNGSFEHEDTEGHTGRANVGDVMLMSAGRGLKHAEHGNADVLTRVITIWLTPRTADAEPHHAIRKPVEQNGWQLVAAERDAPLIVDQDARVLMKRLAPGEHLSLVATPGRTFYLGTVEGDLIANDQRLSVPERIVARDGEVSIASDSGATVVLVDVPQE